MFPTFTIFGTTVGTYGVLAVLGFFAAFFIVYSLLKKSISFEDLIILAVAAGVGLMVGGHLLFALTNIDKFILVINSEEGLFSNFGLRFLIQLFSGNVFYGGLIGSLIFLYFACKIMKKNSVLILNAYAVAIPAFHFFGRVGCFFAGCCYGKPSHWGFVVHNNALLPEINGVRTIPIQLIEAGGNLMIFLLLFFLSKKEKYAHLLLNIYLIVYPCLRFCTELFRGDEARGIWFGLSTSQWISIVLLIISVTDLALRKIKRTI